MHQALAHELLAVPMPDGVRLAADVHRPAGPGRWPTLLMRTPYGRHLAETLLYAHPSWYARHGYAVVIQDVRGRFGSEGTFEPWVHEAADGVATVDWLADQPWCDGRIGMYGFSYPGAAQLLAATEGHPALRAIVPALAPIALGEGFLFDGGAFALAFALGWAMDLAATSRAAEGGRDVPGPWPPRRDDAYRTRPLRAHPLAAPDSAAPYLADWLDHEQDQAYWELRAIGVRLTRLAVPALFVGGWYDTFMGSTLQGYAAAGSPERGLLAGPWQHYPNQPVSGVPADDPRRIEAAQLRWFDRHLRGGDAPDPGPVIHWTGSGVWETGVEWPPPVEARRWYLRSAGRANSRHGDGRLDPEPPGTLEPPDVFVHDPAAPIIVPDANPAGYPLLTPMGPADQLQVEASNGVLVYTSAPLEAMLAIAGRPVVRLSAVSSAEATDWVATLCVVDRHGTSRNLSRGIVRTRTSDGRPSAGTESSWTLALAPVAHVIAAGERIRLQVCSSAYPVWEPNPGTGHTLGTDGPGDLVTATQTVLHEPGAPSWLDLPCRAGWP